MLKIVKTFNNKKSYLVAAVRVSVEEDCVLCEVRNLCQAITAMTISVSVFVFLFKKDGLHVLKLLPVIVSWSLSTRLDTSKDLCVHSGGNNSQ